ncbi:MAG: restriction endonuclease subunit S [Segatella copri]
MRKGWEYKKLGEVCTLISDGSHNPPKGIDHSLYRMISSQNVFDDNLQITEDNVRYITESDHLCENKRTKLQKDVVLLTIVGTIGRSCVLKGNEGCLTLQRSVAALHPSDQIMPRYLMHCLIGNRHTLNQEAHGIAQKGIYLKQLSSLSIPLPPKSTQLAIVSELDKINELIRLKKEQLKDFDNLAQSLFYEMFGDPVENEKGWEAKKLGDVCTDIKYGTSKPASENGRYTYLRMCNLTTDGFLDLSNTKQIDIPDDEIEKCIVRYGDILFNRTNSIELVGKTCLFDKKEPMVIAGYIIRVRLNDTLLPVVLSRMFNLASIKKLLRSMAKGAVNQANINSKELASIRIPLPPLSLQRLFAQRIEQIEREKSEVQKSIQDFETLLASRIQYWFE